MIIWEPWERGSLVYRPPVHVLIGAMPSACFLTNGVVNQFIGDEMQLNLREVTKNLLLR